MTPNLENQAGTATPEDPRIGRVLQDRYRLLARIGEGAMGIVYRGERVSLGRPVAVKFLHAQMAGDPVLVKRFDLEARAMSCLAHPNCVSVIDFGVEGRPYLVMDFVAGVPLRTLLAQGPLPAPRALRIIRQVLAALTHAHAHGIVHRDIKPENILVESASGIEDHVRVLDFGLAKFLGSDVRLTLNSVLGTPNYMAPEMTREGPIDERVDVYAAGVVLMEMMTGRPPFDAPDVGQVFVKLLSMPPPRLRQMLPAAGFSEQLERALVRAMAKQPAERYASAERMMEALGGVPEAQTGWRPAPRIDPRPPVSGLERTIAESLPAFLREADPPPAPVALPLQRPGLAARLLRSAAERRATGERPTMRGRLAQRLEGGIRWIRSSRARLAASAGAALLALALLIFAVARDGGAPAPSRQAPDGSVRAKSVTASASPRTPARPAAAGAKPGVAGSPPSSAPAVDSAETRARSYFERQWWSDGFAAYQLAIQQQPQLKRDPRMLGHLISALQSERVGHKVARHLKELGSPARPHLREAARNHPNHRVRKQAAAILKSSDAKPMLRWLGRR